MYAALGIHSCMPHSHGSQGCCSYHRSHLTRHFKEPVVATTSSFTEGASVFGGLANLQQALVNIFSIYDPEVVAVHTTCLSEVIGDDIPTIIKKSRDEGKDPRWQGGHALQHAEFCRQQCVRLLRHVHGHGELPGGKIRRAGQMRSMSFPGWLNPTDMRELKAIAAELGVETILYPDTSDVLDLPQTGVYTMYPKGGCTVATSGAPAIR